MVPARWSALALAALFYVTPSAAGEGGVADRERSLPQRGGQNASEEQARVEELLDLAQRLRSRADGLRERADELRGLGKEPLAQGMDDKADALETRAGQMEDEADQMQQVLRGKTGGHPQPHRPSGPSQQHRAP